MAPNSEKNPNLGAKFEILEIRAPLLKKKKNVTKYLKTQQMNNGLNEDSNQPLLTPIGRRITNHMDDNKLTISNNKEKKSTFNSGAVWLALALRRKNFAYLWVDFGYVCSIIL